MKTTEDALGAASKRLALEIALRLDNNQVKLLLADQGQFSAPISQLIFSIVHPAAASGFATTDQFWLAAFARELYLYVVKYYSPQFIIEGSTVQLNSTNARAIARQMLLILIGRQFELRTASHLLAPREQILVENAVPKVKVKMDELSTYIAIPMIQTVETFYASDEERTFVTFAPGLVEVHSVTNKELKTRIFKVIGDI